MFGILNIGPWELILILVVMLIVFGPGKLPEVAQSLGKAVREFRKASSNVQRVWDEVTREEAQVKTANGREAEDEAEDEHGDQTSADQTDKGDNTAWEQPAGQPAGAEAEVEKQMADGETVDEDPAQNLEPDNDRTVRRVQS